MATTLKTDALTPDTIATLTDADIDSRIDFIEEDQRTSESGYSSPVREQVLTWLHNERDTRRGAAILRGAAAGRKAIRRLDGVQAQWYLVRAGAATLIVQAASGAAIEDALKREGLDGNGAQWIPLIDAAKAGIVLVPSGDLRILNEVR